jgi:hypothetical protein
MPKLLLLKITGPNASLDLIGEDRGVLDEKTRTNHVQSILEQQEETLEWHIVWFLN